MVLQLKYNKPIFVKITALHNKIPYFNILQSKNLIKKKMCPTAEINKKKSMVLIWHASSIYFMQNPNYFCLIIVYLYIKTFTRLSFYLHTYMQIYYYHFKINNIITAYQHTRVNLHYKDTSIDLFCEHGLLTANSYRRQRCEMRWEVHFKQNMSMIVCLSMICHGDPMSVM